MILDGRNRYRACLAAYGKFPRVRSLDIDDLIDDPAAYVVSANIHRRHLTAEQKRELVEKLLKATPEKSDRQIAKIAKVSPTTVGTKRAKMEKAGDVSKLDTRRDTRGRKQPSKKKVAEGKKPKPSQRELEAKQAHIDELEAAREHDNDLAEQLQAAKIKIAGLESEIEEAKAAAKPAPRSKSRCSVCREKKLAVLRSVFICDRCVEIHEIGEAAPPADDGLDIPEFLPRSAGP